MKARILVGALVAAGVLGTGVAAWQGQIPAPFSNAHATPAATPHPPRRGRWRHPRPTPWPRAFRSTASPSSSPTTVPPW